MLGHLALFVLLELEHPFQGDGVVSIGQINQLPCPILLNGFQLLLLLCIETFVAPPRPR